MWGREERRNTQKQIQEYIFNIKPRKVCENVICVPSMYHNIAPLAWLKDVRVQHYSWAYLWRFIYLVWDITKCFANATGNETFYCDFSTFLWLQKYVEL